MKAFWLPSATPEAPSKVEAPLSCPTCPESNEKLKMKALLPIHFIEDMAEQKKATSVDKLYMCPSSHGHAFCKKCADKFMAVDKVCLVCKKGCKERNLVHLEKGGTSFSAHGDNLEAKDFKHLGSCSGLGLVRPAMKSQLTSVLI